MPPAPTPRQSETPQLLRPPVALTIGGSDSGGGAGIQADLKTFSALQVHGCSAITCLTAQNTCGVERVDGLSAAALTAQVAAVCRDLPVAAVKTGMLLNAALIEATAAAIHQIKAPRVVDPVMVSRTGAVLLEPEAVTAMAALLPQASLITPNLHEAQLLSGRSLDEPEEIEDCARQLIQLGCQAVLIKGGGLPGLQGCDLLCSDGELEWLVSPAIDTRHSHGSGCTLAAAITAGLAQGLELRPAIVAAKAYVTGALRHGLAIGSGAGPLCHWHQSLPPQSCP
jgi:hydroxymethylpyrimidine/phosphomethylpyrimidine kinase